VSNRNRSPRCAPRNNSKTDDLSFASILLKRKDEEHKSLFRGKSMTGPFHTVTYAIEKIFEDLHKNTLVGMGKWGADTLKSRWTILGRCSVTGK